MRRRELIGGLLGLACACGQRPKIEQRGQGTGPSTPEVDQRSRVRVLSYNVLADEVALDRRIPALMRAMEQARPDVIALQEVAPWFLDWIAGSEWLREFELAQIDGLPARPNGQLIASRWPTRATRFRRLPGAQGRTVLITHVELAPAQWLCVATTHMESFLEDGPIRAQQLDVIFEELARDKKDPSVVATVLCGDLNFGDGEQPDTAHLDPEFVDLWATLRAGQPGYTWDIERSEMARLGSFVGEPSRRLDRILLRSRAWQSASIEIIGDQPVEPGDRRLFPSDHFGLIGEISTA
ncbi:MAG TPA: endonuclease/exonuclease/phosphatase family protein [Enhygromyxa sp.]|nr:endonuclease/exonuclease/phosphatase family protein [Enhygromyxa sp.]